MRLPSWLAALASALCVRAAAPAAARAPALGAPSRQPARITDDVAFSRLIANIGGAGTETNVEGAMVGTVVASPSRKAPDYFYSWTRDAALVAKILVDRHGDELAATAASVFHARASESGQQVFVAIENPSPHLAVPLHVLLEKWARSEIVHQSSAASAAAGQGEPKFFARDGSVYAGPWGRPQTDGPALRATALMRFARQIGLNDSFTTEFLYHTDLDGASLIKNDLEYVAHHWRTPSFDLWEELYGHHFFTLSVQTRALLEGAEFAASLGDPAAARFYQEQGSQALAALQGFWDPQAQRVQAYRVPWRSGVDCSAILGSLHGWNQSSLASSLDEARFGPATQRILATVHQYISTFRSLYSLNRFRPAPQPVLTGRYPEDDYAGFERTGGNPWYLCTLATAEALHDAAGIFSRARYLDVTPATHSFFAQWVPHITLGRQLAPARPFTLIVRGMQNLAAGMRDLIQEYAYANGSMSEQIDRYTGKNVGARDLTWNYAAWLAASKASKGTPVF